MLIAPLYRTPGLCVAFEEAVAGCATPNEIFSMTEGGIAANIKYLKSIGIAADRSRSDTSLLEQV
jgi:hypothetical protein